MSYCSVSLVRTVSGLEEEIRDQKIRDVRDNVVIPRVNDDIQTRIDREHVTAISDVKTNVIDGSNTTFYLAETHDNFKALGDLNDDGEVTTDDINAWIIKNDEERIPVTVKSILDDRQGKFEAVNANTNSAIASDADLYVSYRHAPVSVAEPNSMVSLACAQLTGAFCFSNIETPKLKNFTIGDVTIRNQTEGFGIMKDQYTETMRKIVNRELIDFGENKNEIEDVIKRDYAGDGPLGTGKKTVGGRFRSG